MSSMDTLVERRERALVVADVRAFAPGTPVGDARLEIMSGWKQHDDRWMQWRFGKTKVEGYFHSAHGAHAAGWRQWLQETMTPRQYESYQDGEDAGWKGGGIHTANAA